MTIRTVRIVATGALDATLWQDNKPVSFNRCSGQQLIVLLVIAYAHRVAA